MHGEDITREIAELVINDNEYINEILDMVDH